MSIDKAALFAPRLKSETVEIDGLGLIVVRGLSRVEAGQVQARKTAEARERLVLALGMVDPALTESEVGQWMAAADAGEVGKVSKVIGRLSGLLEDSPKATFPDDGSEPGD